MNKWYNWINEALSGAGIVIGVDLISTKELLGLILVIINIIIAILSLVLKVVQWYKNAKADGKITSDEVSEGIEIINTGAEDIKKEIEDSKSSKGDKKDE